MYTILDKLERFTPTHKQFQLKHYE